MKKITKYLFYILLTILSILSLSSGIYKSQKLSHDFLYSPSVLVWEGENHYRYILEEDQTQKKDEKFLYYQRSGYGQALYIIYYPFTKLSWENAKLLWMFINLSLAFFIPILLSRNQLLKNHEIFICVTLFLIGTPVRHVLNMGQQSLFIFFFLILPFLNQRKVSLFLGGISLVKYSIGYGLFLFILTQKNLLKIFLVSLISLTRWLTYCFLTKTNLLINILEPLQTTLHLQNTSQLVYGFSFLKFFLKDLFLINYVVIILSVLASLIFIIKIREIKDSFLKLILLCLVILIFAPHRYHDYVLLLPLLIFSIKNYDKMICKFNLLVVSYFYFFLILLQKYFKVNSDFFQINDQFLLLNNLNLLVLILTLILNLRFISKEFGK